MSCNFSIAHITDTHVGAHSDKIWEALTKSLMKVNPSLYIVSGDITENNREGDYNIFLNWMGNTIRKNANSTAYGLQLGAEYSKRAFIILGNHDYYNNFLPIQQKKGKCRFFKSFPAESFPKWSFLEGKNGCGIFLVGVDSAKPRSIAKGVVSKKDLHSIREWCDSGRHGKLIKNSLLLGLYNGSEEDAISKFNNAYKILVIHHYLFFPRSRQSEYFMKLKNANEVLAQIAIDDFDLVLSGHDHQDTFDNLKYANLLRPRAVRRFARMYYLRQVGAATNAPEHYLVDGKGKLLSRCMRLAVDRLLIPVDAASTSVARIIRVGESTTQLQIKRGRKDFLIYDFVNPEIDAEVRRLAEKIDREIFAVLNRRSLMYCIAPSAIKKGESANGFYEYKFLPGRKISVLPYYYDEKLDEFRPETRLAQEYTFARPLDLVNNEIDQSIRQALGMNGIDPGVEGG